MDNFNNGFNNSFGTGFSDSSNIGNPTNPISPFNPANDQNSINWKKNEQNNNTSGYKGGIDCNSDKKDTILDIIIISLFIITYLIIFHTNLISYLNHLHMQNF